MRVYQFRHVGNEDRDYKVMPCKVNVFKSAWYLSFFEYLSIVKIV